jgi:transcriptional regulator with XRE-family HTH domain
VNAAEESTPSDELGQRLKKLRIQAGKTLADLSLSTGVSTANLSKIENNLVSPSFDIVKKFARDCKSALRSLCALAGRKRKFRGERR